MLNHTRVPQTTKNFQSRPTLRVTSLIINCGNTLDVLAGRYIPNHCLLVSSAPLLCAVILATQILGLRQTVQTSLPTVGNGSTASRVNNGALKDLHKFSCIGYGTLHTVLPLCQTPVTDGRLLDVDAVSLWPELDMCRRDARMKVQLAP